MPGRNGATDRPANRRLTDTVDKARAYAARLDRAAGPTAGDALRARLERAIAREVEAHRAELAATTTTTTTTAGRGTGH